MTKPKITITAEKNTLFKELRTEKYKQRVVKNKKAYNRKTKNNKDY